MTIEPVDSSSILLLSKEAGSNVENHGLVCDQEHTRASEWARWTTLVQQVESGSAEAESELCQSLIGGLRFHFLRKRRRDDSEDLAHETLLAVLQAIRNKELREPARLMGFVRVIAHRTLCAAFRSAERQCRRCSKELTDTVIDNRCDPEAAVLSYERAAMVREGLQALSELDRNILTLFYLRRQSPEFICKELNLTENQFRLKKSRAKARLGKLSQRIRGRRQLTMRASTSATVVPFSQGRVRQLGLERMDPLRGNSVNGKAIAPQAPKQAWLL